MAYITAEEVKAKRDALKAAFPAKKGWKFSVRRVHGSKIDVAILAAPIDFFDPRFHDLSRGSVHSQDENMEAMLRRCAERGNMSVNHHHFRNSYQGEALAALEQIIEIIQEGNFDESDTSSDYFHVGFWVNVGIGRWDQPFKCTVSA